MLGRNPTLNSTVFVVNPPLSRSQPSQEGRADLADKKCVCVLTQISSIFSVFFGLTKGVASTCNLCLAYKDGSTGIPCLGREVAGFEMGTTRHGEERSQTEQGHLLPKLSKKENRSIKSLRLKRPLRSSNSTITQQCPVHC